MGQYISFKNKKPPDNQIESSDDVLDHIDPKYASIDINMNSSGCINIGLDKKAAENARTC